MASVDFRRQLEKANITPEKPLHAILITVMEAAQDAKLSKTLSGHGEEALARRVAEMAVRAVERQMDRLTWQKRAAILIRGMAMGAMMLAAGYLLAHWEIAGFAVPQWGDAPPPPVRR